MVSNGCFYPVRVRREAKMELPAVSFLVFAKVKTAYLQSVQLVLLKDKQFQNS